MKPEHETRTINHGSSFCHEALEATRHETQEATRRETLEATSHETVEATRRETCS